MTLRGITFSDPATGIAFHTGDDWDLVMSEKFIGMPPVKFKTITLADRDGDLDYTDALRGIPSYGTRKLRFRFEYLGDPHEWTALFTTIRNVIHGRRLHIFEPDDQNYYFTGRCEVGDPDGGIVKKFEILVTADTWRLKNGGETVVSETVSSGDSIMLINDWRPVVPTIEVDKTIQIRFNGTTYTLSGAGSFKIPGIQFTHGNNTIEIVSADSVTISFTYQEGAI